MKKNLSGIIDPTKSLKTLERFTGISPILPSTDILHSFKKAKAKYEISARIRTKPNSYYLKDLEKFEKSQVDKTAMQQITSERLWKGKILKDPKIPKIADLESESKIKFFNDTLNQDEENRVNFFLNTLTAFKKMKDLLLMNFKISKIDETGNGSSVDGLLLELKDLAENVDRFGKVEYEELLKYFLILNTYFREIIRILKGKKEHKAAETTEILWRVIVKLVDSAVWTHFLYAGEFSDMIQGQTRDLFKEKTQELSKIQSHFENEVKTLVNENQRLKEALENTKVELENVRIALIQKKNELKELIRFENRDKDLENLKKLLSSFDSFIEDTEKEKVRQMIVLKSVANLINSAEDLTTPAEKVNVKLQTDPYNFEIINYGSSYEDYLSVFGTSFGEVGSKESINAFVSLIKRDLEPKNTKRSSIKRRIKTIKN